jgi:TRAP-type C4-dicarboxylate transport system substrate-binding protein
MKMYTAAKNVTLTGIVNWSVPVYVSKAWWDKVPADLRAQIVEQSKAVEAELVAWNDQANEDALKAWKENGGTYDRLPAADQKRLLDTIKPVVAQVLAERPPVNELFLQVSAIAKANE